MEIMNDDGNVVIKMSSPEDAKKVVRVFDYARFLELTKGIAVAEAEVDSFMEEVNESQRKYVKERYKL